MTNDYLYIFDKITKKSTNLGEIQSGFNMSFVIDGTKDSAKVIVWSWSGEEVEPYTIAWHKNTDTWWVVSSDNVERTLNEEGFLYIHTLTLVGAIELLNARDLTDCGFNDNTYTINQFITRLFHLSTFEYNITFAGGTDINFLNKNVDFIKTFENYTLLSALRELLDAYNMYPKLTFAYTVYEGYTLLNAVIHLVPKTGDYSLTTHDENYFIDIKETKTISKESFGTCVVSNAENVISTRHKTYPATGSVKLGSSQYMIVEGVHLKDGLIRLPSKVYKGNWIKIVYPLKVTLFVQGTVTHTFTYTYQRTQASYDALMAYFAQKIKDDTGNQSIANTFLSYASAEMKNNMDLASVVTLYDGNNINSFTGDITKGADVPYLAELYFVSTSKPVIFTDKATKNCLKDIKQGIAWERGSNLITGFDMFDGSDRLQVHYSDFHGNHFLVQFEQSDISITMAIGQDTLKEVSNLTPSLANQLKKLSFIIDYIPMTDLKVKVDNQRDKKDIQLYNQNGKITDNVALSKLINSYSKEISSDTITKYRQDFSYSDCPKVGSIVFVGNNPYVINNVSLDVSLNENSGEMGYFINGEYTMSKYISTKSIMVNPNTNIRDYGIPQNFNVKRKQLYRDYYELNYELYDDNETEYYLDPSNIFIFEHTPNILDNFVAVIKLTYENEINGSTSWYYQLDTTTYYLDKMIYSVLDFNDNNIIGYGSQNVFSGFDIGRIFQGLTDTINTPISYVDEKGKVLGVDILYLDNEQIMAIYDYYLIKWEHEDYVGLYNYSVFIPSDIYDDSITYSAYKMRITESSYKKDALEVPVFEYACQVDDSNDVLIGDNILTQYEGNIVYFYSYVKGHNLNQNNISTSNRITTVVSPAGYMVNDGAYLLYGIQNHEKILAFRLYDSSRLETDDMSWHNGTDVNVDENYDYAIFRHTLDLTTQEEKVELMLIAKNVPESAIHNNKAVWLKINHYKLR